MRSPLDRSDERFTRMIFEQQVNGRVYDLTRG